MTDRVVRKLHFTPKLLLRVAGWLTVAAVALFVLVAAAQSRVQTSTDNSQFNGHPPMPPPSQQLTDANNTGAAPSLYDALQQELGLKLSAEKAPVDVIVIDHAEKPTES